MLLPPPSSKLNLIQRLLAASSFTLLVGAALLIWTTYQDRAAGMTGLNLLRGLGALVLVMLSAYGTRLRHRRILSD